jgi:hypothetical protein
MNQYKEFLNKISRRVEGGASRLSFGKYINNNNLPKGLGHYEVYLIHLSQSNKNELKADRTNETEESEENGKDQISSIWQKLNRSLPWAFSFLLVASVLVLFLKNGKFQPNDVKLNLSDLSKIGSEYMADLRVYRLYYIDPFISFNQDENFASQLSEAMSKDEQLKDWNTSSSGQSAFEALSNWMLAAPNARKGEKFDLRLIYDKTDWSKIWQPYLHEPQNVISLINQLPKKEDSHTGSLKYFTPMFTHITETTQNIVSERDDFKKKHIIINILSDFNADDLTQSNIQDWRDLQEFKEMVDRVSRLPVVVEFNLISNGPTQQNKPTTSTDELVNAFLWAYPATTVYSLESLLNARSLADSLNYFSNFFLSLQVPTINVKDYKGYRNYSLTPETSSTPKSSILNPPNFRYQLNCPLEYSRQSFFMLHGELYQEYALEKASIKFKFRTKTQSKPLVVLDSWTPYSTDWASGDAFHLERLDNQFSGRYNLLLYHRGLDNKFFVPIAN